MKRVYIASIIIIAGLTVLFGVAIAIDPPHDASTTTNCQSCHSLHNAVGPSLTKEAENYNLCMTCHAALGSASTLPFAATDQATPGTSGTSHRWDASMPLTDNPNNPYGLRKVDSLTNTALKARLGVFGTCSNPSYTNKSTCESGGGTWTAKVVCSVCHNLHSQSAATWDPNAPAYSGSGTGSGRHYQRAANDLNQLCEDCHYYRTPASGETDVRNWSGNKKSHPVAKIFTSANGETRDVTKPQQYHTSPLEPQAASWTAQTGGRYHLNGTGDSNPTNNIVVGSDGKIRCLSCHGIHYTDSDSTTVDQP